MKIVFIGTVEFSQRCLQKLIELNADIGGVITKKESAFHADFVDLTNVARKNEIPCFYAEDINASETVNWINARGADIIFCFGWSQLLKKEVLEAASMGAVGYHPAKLPQNRGRHPLVWALVLGLEQTGSTFFFIDENADSGDILSQKDIVIEYEDTAKTLYEKMTYTALQQIEELLPQLQQRQWCRVPQDNSQATYWRKRSRLDGQINFNKDSHTIYNLVRALTKPYVGAHIHIENEDVKVWKASEISVKENGASVGEVLEINEDQILVKCKEGAILFEEHEFKKYPKVGSHLS